MWQSGNIQWKNLPKSEILSCDFVKTMEDISFHGLTHLRLFDNHCCWYCLCCATRVMKCHNHLSKQDARFGVRYIFQDFCVSKQPSWDTWQKFSVNSSKPASRLLGILNKQQECPQIFILKNKKGIVNISIPIGPRHYGRMNIKKMRCWGAAERSSALWFNLWGQINKLQKQRGVA